MTFGITNKMRQCVVLFCICIKKFETEELKVLTVFGYLDEQSILFWAIWLK